MIEKLQRWWKVLVAVRDGDIERQIAAVDADVALTNRRIRVVREQLALLRSFVQDRHECGDYPNPIFCPSCRVLERCKEIEDAESTRVDA